jgi:replicative DNA helicase
LPIYSMAELEPGYSKYCQQLDKAGLSLHKWLPSFRRVRPLVPGELVMFLGGTGVGKTALLSNLAVAAAPMPTLFFQLELPPELLFERLLALKTKMACNFIEEGYKTGDSHGNEVLNRHFPGLFISTQPRLAVTDIEQLINRAELKMGERPRLILVDYVGLLQGKGSSRYDRFSQIAEDLKVMAKATQTVVVCACQIARKSADDGVEVTLTDAKDSGSIENSSGLVIGAWRDADDGGMMHLRILKNTKGKAGDTITCNYNLQTLQITERAMMMPA